MLKILKYSIFDIMRSRWSYVYFAFFLLTCFGLLYLSPDMSRAIVSLMNIIIILCPLVGMMFGIMYFYNSRDFAELLLSQPIKRSSVFFGNYMGLASSLSLSFLLGMGIPFLAYGILISGEVWNFLVLLLTGVLLTFSFTALAFLIALKNENKIKGFGIAIMVWLTLAVIYDGLFLLLLVFFQDYPTEKFALGATILNPIDLSRILIMLKLDIAALLGYTGAVFNKFFGTSLGIIIALGCSLLWVVIPVFSFLKVGMKKDF